MKELQHHLQCCNYCIYTFRLTHRYQRRTVVSRDQFFAKLERNEFSSYQLMYRFVVYGDRDTGPPAPIQGPARRNPMGFVLWEQPENGNAAAEQPENENAAAEQPENAAVEQPENENEAAEHVEPDNVENIAADQEAEDDERPKEVNDESQNNASQGSLIIIENEPEENPERLRQSTIRQKLSEPFQKINFPTADYQRYEQYQENDSNASNGIVITSNIGHDSAMINCEDNSHKLDNDFEINDVIVKI